MLGPSWRLRVSWHAAFVCYDGNLVICESFVGVSGG